MQPLLTIILHRPYVFAFLAAYLFLAWRRWGWPRTALWLASGYAIAWLSEYSSIHNGFPYGEYHYVYENLRGELLIAGVPFFDSLSYVFLTFAGFTMGECILSRHEAKYPLTLTLSPWGRGKRVLSLSPQGRGKGEGWFLIVLGALLTTLLDVVVDPIATMGDRWFLGQIHFYAHPGWYFGVPMTNFAGWFLVSLAVCGFNALAWRIFPGVLNQRASVPAYQRTTWMYPAFYTSIALFSIAISFWVGEWKLGLASSAILAVILCAVVLTPALRRSPSRRTGGSLGRPR